MYDVRFVCYIEHRESYGFLVKTSNNDVYESFVLFCRTVLSLKYRRSRKSIIEGKPNISRQAPSGICLEVWRCRLYCILPFNFFITLVPAMTEGRMGTEQMV